MEKTNVILSLIVSIIAIFSAIIAVLAFFWKRINKNPLIIKIQLSKEEKDIIRNGQNTIHLMSTDQTGDYVRAGKQNYYFSDNKELTQKYTEALQKLLQKKLIKHESRILYKVTSLGHKIYDML